MRLSSPKHRAIGITLLGLVLGLAQAGDGDHDGIPDHRDECPNTAQLKMLPANFKYRFAVAPERYSSEPKAWPVNPNGCEADTDHDGVIDSQDYCPRDSAEAISKGVAANGCPRHSDRDGTPDFRDLCPDTPAGLPTDASGCPV